MAFAQCICILPIFVFVTCIASASESPEINATQTNTSDQQRSFPTKFNLIKAPRQYFISNRDSYVDAANSFGNKGTLSTSNPNTAAAASAAIHHGNGFQTAMNSYQVPQSSYGAPMNHGGYQSGGYGYDDEDGQSSKGGDLAGLIGLIGLKGLKGTIPLIITGLFSLLPVLIPLSILKIGLILLKPVITFGRSSPTPSFIADFLQLNPDSAAIVDKVASLDNDKALTMGRNIETSVNSTSSSWLSSEGLYSEIVDASWVAGNEILGKDADNQCMQRIACEGLIKSLPRIFLRVLAEHSMPVSRKHEDTLESDNTTNSEFSTARRKDLATLALNRLKNPQYLTKKPSVDDFKDTSGVCRQYKCSTLF